MICGRCHKEIEGRSATSRRDPNIKVCAMCGVEEALEDVPDGYLTDKNKQEVIQALKEANYGR